MKADQIIKNAKLLLPEIGKISRMQYTVAESNGVDCIIPRNKGDFEKNAIPCYNPREFLEKYWKGNWKPCETRLRLAQHSKAQQSIGWLCAFFLSWNRIWHSGRITAEFDGACYALSSSVFFFWFIRISACLHEGSSSKSKKEGYIMRT